MPKRNYTIPDMDAFVEERLSDYLDGRLSAEERALVEAHLQKSERARASLEALRWTVNLIKQTPAPALPRQFTLPVTPRAPQRVTPGWFVWGLRGIAIAATLAFVFFLAANLLRQNNNPATALAPAAAPLPAAAQPSQVALGPTPMATFGNPPQQESSGAPAATALPFMITLTPLPPTVAAQPVIPITVTPEPTQVLAQPTEAPPPPAAAQDQNTAPVIALSPTAPHVQIQNVAPTKAQPTPNVLPTQKAQPTNPPSNAKSAQGNAPTEQNGVTNTPTTLSISSAQLAPEATATETPLAIEPFSVAATHAPPTGTAATNAAISSARTVGPQLFDGIVMATQLNVRQGPGLEYRTIGSLRRNQHISVIGRSERNVWLAIQFSSSINNRKMVLGWVGAAYVKLNVPLNNLPVLDANGVQLESASPTPILPTATPTPTDTPTLTPTSSETPSETPSLSFFTETPTFDATLTETIFDLLALTPTPTPTDTITP